MNAVWTRNPIPGLDFRHCGGLTVLPWFDYSSDAVRPGTWLLAHADSGEDLLVIESESIDRALEIASVIVERTSWASLGGEEQMAALVGLEDAFPDEVSLLPPAYAFCYGPRDVPVFGYVH